MVSSDSNHAAGKECPYRMALSAAGQAPLLVTFDLFSALLDSRSGASAVLGALARRRGWPLPGTDVYDDWDRRNKQLQRDVTGWRSFRRLSTDALAGTFAALGLVGDPARDAAVLLGSVGSWPMWPDVAEGLSSLAGLYDVGILSNVDDEIFARTQVAALVDDDYVLTSERLRAYKPSPSIYRRAREAARGGRHVHVATSARDVRGAVDAGSDVIRLLRQGHDLPVDGPAPRHLASSVSEVADLLARYWL
jgi:2-haloalkanoic acid dehalogenase type II